MNIDNHLLLDTLEQMRELLSSPDIASRTDEAFLTQAIKEFYSLIDEYAVAQSPDVDAPEDPEKIKEIGMAAQNFVTQHHNHKKVAQLYLDTWKLSRL